MSPVQGQPGNVELDIPHNVPEMTGCGAGIKAVNVLIYTFHSAWRLIERGIRQEDVLDAIAAGELVESRDGKDTHALGRLRVVVAREQRVVITAWRVRVLNGKQAQRKARRNRRKYRQAWG